MAAPFAALESRLNRAVLSHLANATASAYNAHGQLQTFDVVFDAATEPQFAGLVSDAAPQVQCQTSDVTHVVWDSGITVAGTAYSVATIRHDGTGLTTLTLREA